MSSHQPSMDPNVAVAANLLSSAVGATLKETTTAAAAGSHLRQAGDSGSGGTDISTAGAGNLCHPLGQNIDGGLVATNLLTAGNAALGEPLGNGAEVHPPTVVDLMIQSVSHQMQCSFSAISEYMKAEKLVVEKKNEELAQRVANLEAQVMEKDGHIQELEKKIEDKDLTISTLEKDKEYWETQTWNVCKENSAIMSQTEEKMRVERQRYDRDIGILADKNKENLEKQQKEMKAKHQENMRSIEADMKKATEEAAAKDKSFLEAKRDLEKKLASSEALRMEYSERIRRVREFLGIEVALAEVPAPQAPLVQEPVQDSMSARRPSDVRLRTPEQDVPIPLEPARSSSGDISSRQAVVEPNSVHQGNQQAQGTSAQKQKRGNTEPASRRTKKPKTMSSNH